jgi:alpha-beta hydrolase superfamily lysophospholipase
MKTLIWLWVTIGLFLTTACASAHVSEETISLAGLRVTVWSQTATTSAPQPVVLFSHGFHGCSTQSTFLMEALALDGFLVFAPNHADATCNGGTAQWSDPPPVPFINPQAWSDSTLQDRAQDIDRLVQAISTDLRFRDRADLSRLALVGHSAGGYTMLGLSGAWAGWRLSGVKAVLALSPYDQPFLVHQTLAGLSAPVMYQGGTLDVGVTPSLQKPGGGYDQSPPSKYFVELWRTGHLAWADIGNPETHPLIVAYSVAFLNHYVNGTPAPSLLTHPQPGVARLRYDSELGHSGR